MISELKKGMQSTALDKGRFSRLAMTMAMLAVLIRVLIPSGYMVSPNIEAGGSKIVICSPKGAIEVLVDASGQRIKAPTNHDKGKVGEHPCAFSVATTASLSGDMALVSAPAAYVDLEAAASTPIIRPGLGLAAPPPPKTGPPVQL